jgi:hypothetical protein
MARDLCVHDVQLTTSGTHTLELAGGMRGAGSKVSEAVSHSAGEEGGPAPGGSGGGGLSGAWPGRCVVGNQSSGRRQQLALLSADVGADGVASSGIEPSAASDPVCAAASDLLSVAPTRRPADAPDALAHPWAWIWA